MKVRNLIILTIFLAMGCAKEALTPPESEEVYGTIVRKAEGTITKDVIGNLDNNNYLLAVEDSQVRYSSQIPNPDQFEVGKIIIGNPDKFSEYGFLRRITSIEKTATEIILHTEQASLGDAFNGLNIDVAYNHDGSKWTRGPGDIELTELPPAIIGLPASGSIINTASFGFTGGPFCRVTSNPNTEKIEQIQFGVENLKYQLDLNTRIELIASSETASKEFILPIKMTMAVPIGPSIVITIVARWKLTPSMTPEARGLFEFTQSICPGPFNMTSTIKPFANTLPEAFSQTISANIPPSLEDLNYSFGIDDLAGQIACSYNIPLTLEIAPFGAFDAISAGVELDMINYSFNAKTETDNGKLQARVKSDISSSGKFFISSGFIEEFVKKSETGTIIDFVPPYELEAYKVSIPYDDEIYCFPCEKEYTNVRIDNSCEDHELKFNVRVNANKPGNTGYRVELNGESIGVYDYNELHTFSKPKNQVSNLIELVVKDEESFGCLIKRTLVNECVAEVYCPPNTNFTDVRDGEEYCYLTRNGKKIMTRNLAYKDLGVCYDNLLANCIVLGRLYTYDEAVEACPAGWRLPTISEMRSVLSGLGNDEILSPVNGGSSASSIGLNFLAAGEYHSWAVADEKFGGSVIDSDPLKYLYWTSDTRPSENAPFSDQNAVAFDIVGKIPVVSPKKAGLPCRCIKE